MSDTENANDNAAVVAAADSSSAVDSGSADAAAAASADQAGTDAAASGAADADADAAADGSAAAADADAAAATADANAEADEVDDLTQVKALLGDGSELAVEVATAAVQILGAAGHQVAVLAEHLVASIKHLLAPFEVDKGA